MLILLEIVEANFVLFYAQKLDKDKHCLILTDALCCTLHCSAVSSRQRGRATSEQAGGSVSACRTGAYRVVEKERVRLEIGINIEIFHLLEIILDSIE